MNFFFFLAILLTICPKFSAPKTYIDVTNDHESVYVFEKKTFSSGPMGIGLIESYHNGKNKICIYSTVKGQQKVKFKNKFDECPLDFPK